MDERQDRTESTSADGPRDDLSGRVSDAGGESAARDARGAPDATEGHTEDRDRYAAAIECAIGLNVDCGGTTGVHRVRDAVLAVRDQELEQLRARVVTLEHVAAGNKRHVQLIAPELWKAEAERDGAYRERARLVAHLAALYPSHIGHTDPSTPDWAVVIIEAPGGQMSWHVSPRDMDLFDHVMPTNRICRGWDGHTTDEKYERLRRLTKPGRPVGPSPAEVAREDRAYWDDKYEEERP